MQRSAPPPIDGTDPRLIRESSEPSGEIGYLPNNHDAKTDNHDKGV